VNTIDAPGTTCSFHNHLCSTQMAGHGGFDEHHEFPVSLGGAAGQTTMLVLCPNHHRRQHALIRYLVELFQSGNLGAGDPAVTGQFTVHELLAANSAVKSWIEAGQPVIASWPCPAARA
jgi:hypothetical protein